jgi:hypothetical protein
MTSKLREWLSASLCAALVACTATPKLPGGEVIGKELVQQEVLPFARVAADPAAHFERTLLVEASVTAVCKKAGCWMQIEDQGHKAMVRWESGCGGEFTFPTAAVGKRVVIQGSFYPKEISEADAQHLEEEAGAALAIERRGYEFNASAVLLPAGT